MRDMRWEGDAMGMRIETGIGGGDANESVFCCWVKRKMGNGGRKMGDEK